MNFEELWEQGMDIAQYLGHMDQYQKEMKNRLRDVRITPSECQRMREYLKVRKLFILSDPGCSDCLMNIPIIVKMIECAPNITYRIYDRNIFPAFKSYLLEKNLNKIPLCYILDQDFNPVNFWMERPKSANKLMDQWKTENPDYEILKNSSIANDESKMRRLKTLKSMYLDEMWNWYDTNLQSETIKEVLAKLD